VRRQKLRGALAILLALALIGAVGCGDDGDDEGTSSVPEITIPEGEAETTSTTETETVPDSDSGGSGGTGIDTEKPDSPANDIPPAPDTPEARFEDFCKKNPGVCG
jgi:hypothetical protein